MSIHFTSRELATVLAALRYWQQILIENGEVPISEHFADHVRPINPDEIDDLCERLNLEPSPRKNLA